MRVTLRFFIVPIVVGGIWFFTLWLLLFTILEFSPVLRSYIDLRFLKYYRAQLLQSDPDLMYRFAPGKKHQGVMSKGLDTHPILGHDFSPLSWQIESDSKGFLVSSPGPYEVVALGDSFLVLGEGKGSLYTDFLEKNLNKSVMNLGVPSYGPYQYLTALQLMASAEKPKIALLHLYAENDLIGIENFEKWKAGDQSVAPYFQSDLHFFERFMIATKELFDFFASMFTEYVRYPIAKRRGRMTEDLDMIAAVKLKMADKEFWDVLHSFGEVVSEEDLLRMQPTIDRLKSVITDYVAYCQKEKILPILVYIPSKVSVYAPYVSEETGSGWKKRSNVVRNRWNLKNYILDELSQIEGLQLVDLSPTLDSLCKSGKPPYLRHDLHWNKEGMKTAARFVGEAIQELMP